MSDLVKELRERAVNARLEGTATAHADADYFQRSADRIEALEADNARLREALTPSGATKDAYDGKFFASQEFKSLDGGAVHVHVPVPWETVKSIMYAISGHAEDAALAEKGADR